MSDDNCDPTGKENGRIIAGLRPASASRMTMWTENGARAIAEVFGGTPHVDPAALGDLFRRYYEDGKRSASASAEYQRGRADGFEEGLAVPHIPPALTAAPASSNASPRDTSALREIRSMIRSVNNGEAHPDEVAQGISDSVVALTANLTDEITRLRAEVRDARSREGCWKMKAEGWEAQALGRETGSAQPDREMGNAIATLIEAARQRFDTWTRETYVALDDAFKRYDALRAAPCAPAPADLEDPFNLPPTVARRETPNARLDLKLPADWLGHHEPDDRGQEETPSSGADHKRALDWILSRFDESGNEDDADALVRELLDPVRLETIAQCKAAHDAGIPWGTPFTRSDSTKGGT